MEFKEIGTSMRNWIDSVQESRCECGIESLGPISYIVR